MKFSDLIDPFSPAISSPPRKLSLFVGWCLSGTFPIIAIAALVSMVVGASEVVAFWVIGWVIDLAVDHGPVRLFADNWPLFLFIAVFFILLRPAVMWLSASLQNLAVNSNLFPLIMSRLHRHTLGQAMTFFDDDFAGRIAQKQQQTGRAVSDVVHELLQAGGFAIAAVIGAVFLVGSIHPGLAIGLLIWAALVVVLVRWFIPRIRIRAKERAAARAMVTGQLVDTITNIQTVKLFAHDAYEDEAALEALSTFRDKSLAFSELVVWFRTTINTLAGFLPVFMIGGAALLWSQGIATTGEIAASAMVATRLSQMTGWVSFTALGIFSNIGEVEDGMQTLARDHQITDKNTAIAPQNVAGKLAFEGISFGYGREGAGLNDFNLTLASGEKVGLVGRSGAGKTTVVSLLLRLYEVEIGRVTIDDVDIRDLTQNGLRQQISTVTQDTAMFNRSAMENIRYGNPDATDEEVMKAAKQAEAHEFIGDLQDFRGRQGYEAHLGERGVKLSGGQRQRIALARAILKNAPILVLDEATSALDSEIEAAIQETLYRLMEGKTVIAIAHRLSTIARMDRIVVLNKGTVVEEGNHATLIAQKGVYSDFWSRQSGGFIGVEAAE